MFLKGLLSGNDEPSRKDKKEGVEHVCGSLWFYWEPSHPPDKTKKKI